ncbi:FAD-dependent oxidoreductase [Sulfolobales archaeon HS-7]|nr:FAD-dependent oxidoreductase [Sulfolobales archaeon HS-7]
MKIAVIGGGIVGTLAAFLLKRNGFDVKVFERKELGYGSIHAAGLIEPYRFDKINSTSMVIRMASYMIRGSTAISKFDNEWVLSLMKIINENPPAYVWDELKEMGRYSLNFYRELAQEKNDFSFSDKGVAEVYISEESFENAIEEEKLNPLNPKYEVIDHYRFSGGILYPELESLSTEKFIEHIGQELNQNLVIRDVHSFSPTEIDNEKFDMVIISTGFETRKLGIPVTGFSGYGFLVKGEKVNCPIVIADLGVAYNSYEEVSKLTAGFDMGWQINEKRRERLLVLAGKYLDIKDTISSKFGIRPCTPDGFPVVCWKDGYLFLTGNCRLGWSYAPAMAKLAIEAAKGRKDFGFFSRFCSHSGGISL